MAGGQASRMTAPWTGLTLDEIRTRMAAAGVEIAEDRLDLVRDLVNMAVLRQNRIRLVRR